MSKRSMRDVSYARRPSDMVHQAALRRYLTNRINCIVAPLQQRASIAKSQYSQRPLLKANYPIFNVLYRNFQQIVQNLWTNINSYILRLTPSAMCNEFENGVPGLTHALSVLVDQLYEIIAIPDVIILDKLKRELREKCEAHFEMIHRRCRKIPVLSDAVTGEKEYHKFLSDAYMNEISLRLDNAHDQSSITSVRMLISRHRKHLGEMVDKIEKLAIGEASEDSFILSDLSEDDS